MSVTRRLAAVGAAAALSVTGLAVAAPATAQAATCEAAASVKDGTYNISKRILGNNEVAPGGEVTTEITVKAGATFETVKQIVDYHPAELEPVSVRTEAYFAGGGHKWVDDAFSVLSPTATAVNSSGWTVALGHVTVRITYKVSEDAEPGSLLNDPSGLKVVYGITSDTVADDMGVCVKIREKNVVENVTGSLDGMGLGSATGSADGGSAGSQISSDPSGFVADVINQLDLGQMLGLS
ncbi:MAG TPA: hypothetical protein GXZ45_06985 [Propionibacterium sp.]|nr:hypothetical protein [Propionibacterium sp.]